MTKPVKHEVPYIEMACDGGGCKVLIYVPSDTFITCVTCKRKLCVVCGKSAIEYFGNKYREVAATYCNSCHLCTSDNDDESSQDGDYDSDN